VPNIIGRSHQSLVLVLESVLMKKVIIFVPCTGAPFKMSLPW
jgi:hypothetical protein